MDRRHWFHLISLLAAARQGTAQQPSGERPPTLSKDQIAAGLKLIGLEFSDSQIEMMRRGVERALADYEKLRKIDIPYDTEPAFCFLPGLPERPPRPGPARFRPTPSAVPKKKFWTSAEELAFLPVTQLAPLVRAKLVTSTELTHMYLDRLERFGPKLNCVITLTRDIAMGQAKQADEEIRRGRYRGPLHGIPYGLKDLFAVKGVRTTWGAEPFEKQVIDCDSTVYERLRAAGAVLLAKLSMGALAMGGLWFGGMTKTPWNTEQTSSGSSAGSAAATAAGLVGFAIGTETRGSIVSPCIRCGVAGLRPTYGRISRYGAMGLSWTMDKIGPICRGVEDCALVLRNLYGPDGKDRTVADTPFHWEALKPLSSLRIGVVQKAFDETKGELKDVLAQALADLRKAGVNMQPVEISDSSAASIGFLLNAEAAAAFDDITRDGRVSQLKGQAPGDWPNSFRTSRLVPAVEYIRAQRARTVLIRDLERFFEKWDAVVCPPYSNLGATNLTGHPQVIVPCGFVKGMPQGISFLGRLWDEGSPLRIALAFEQATEWHNKRPPLA